MHGVVRLHAGCDVPLPSPPPPLVPVVTAVLVVMLPEVQHQSRLLFARRRCITVRTAIGKICLSHTDFQAEDNVGFRVWRGGAVSVNKNRLILCEL